MSSQFSVNLDQLDQIVSRLNGLAGFLHDHLDELDHKVAALQAGSWESAAASAYTDAHTQWLTGLMRSRAIRCATCGRAPRSACSIVLP
jgi:WXG100 family type VII secretion target